MCKSDSHQHQQNHLTDLDTSLANQLNSDFNSAWYGTFKLSPDEPDPTPNGPLYPPTIYGSYDPNWREFVG